MVLPILNEVTRPSWIFYVEHRSNTMLMEWQGSNNLLSISCSKDAAKSVPIFSEENVTGFHSLVIGTLKGYAYSVLDLENKYAKLVSMDYRALEM